jgi:hypothetical protein
LKRADGRREAVLLLRFAARLRLPSSNCGDLTNLARKKDSLSAASHPAQSESKERVREDFWWVYEKLGGREALLCWAEENMKEFFKTFLGLFQKETPQGDSPELLVRALRAVAGEDDGPGE